MSQMKVHSYFIFSPPRLSSFRRAHAGSRARRFPPPPPPLEHRQLSMRSPTSVRTVEAPVAVQAATRDARAFLSDKHFAPATRFRRVQHWAQEPAQRGQLECQPAHTSARGCAAKCPTSNLMRMIVELVLAARRALARALLAPQRRGAYLSWSFRRARARAL